ncbi:Os10g0165900 [Oryza sativa Japonica Group]|uniref:Os10g0165900 protein n=1 Tax=Oryza sativa subsp. japonica TaxID=39947 RepID=A0A0P0XSC8_ORYSJ|nr:Os10g0165900 [Oryza sativa Japonica Group]
MKCGCRMKKCPYGGIGLTLADLSSGGGGGGGGIGLAAGLTGEVAAALDEEVGGHFRMADIAWGPIRATRPAGLHLRLPHRVPHVQQPLRRLQLRWRSVSPAATASMAAAVVEATTSTVASCRATSSMVVGE